MSARKLALDDLEVRRGARRIATNLAGFHQFRVLRDPRVIDGLLRANSTSRRCARRRRRRRGRPSRRGPSSDARSTPIQQGCSATSSIETSGWHSHSTPSSRTSLCSAPSHTLRWRVLNPASPLAFWRGFLRRRAERVRIHGDAPVRVGLLPRRRIPDVVVGVDGRTRQGKEAALILKRNPRAPSSRSSYVE
jgi:hypothetical protein